MSSFHAVLLTLICYDVAKHAVVTMDLNEFIENVVMGFWISMLMHAFLGTFFPSFSARLKDLNAAAEM